MKIYLAGVTREKVTQGYFNFNRLESFEYIKNSRKPIGNKLYNSFLLDSGAFTFMNSCKQNINWNKYVHQIAEFINKNDIKYFFELDIDVVIGIKEVENLRRMLEKLVNKKCIPVFHKSRGKDYWLRMIQEYDYVSIGGIVTKEFRQKDHRYFEWFIEQAEKYNCKVHGLGFTSIEKLRNYKFYSVDSTSWLAGGKFGVIYLFNGKTMETHRTEKSKFRIFQNKLDRHNFLEWVKFSQYAEGNL